MNSRFKLGAVCAVLGILVSSCAQQVVTQVPGTPTAEGQSISTHEDLIRGVCNGGTIPNAAPYQGGPGPHPIFLISSSQSNEKGWNEPMPDTWLPASLDALQLVGCLGPSVEKTIQSCSYNVGPNIERIQFTRDIRVVEASSGKVVYDDVIRGGSPPICPETAPREVTRNVGTPITPETLMNFLSPIVENGRLPMVVLTGEPGFLVDVRWSPDGTKIASINELGKLVIWDAVNNLQVNSLQNHEGNSLSGSIDWSPDGTWLVDAGIGKVVLVNAKSYETRILDDFGKYSWIESVNFSPDGNLVFVSSRPMTIWDARTWDKEELESDGNRHPDSAWSPTGDILAIASGENVVRWDVVQGQWLEEWEGDSNTLESLAWSPDGQRVAAGTADNVILIWDAKTGQKYTTLTGHARHVIGLDWSPNGTRLASASMDGTVIIWNTSDYSQINSLVLKSANCLYWSPDAKTLAICTGNDLMFWMVP